MAYASDPTAAAEASAGVLAGLDAFVKNGSLEQSEKLAQQDVAGDVNEPESGEPESHIEQGEAESASDDELDTDETESQPPQKFKVKVDGEELEITVDEALAGYSREADYRRKTAMLAENQRKWEAEKEQSLKADREAIVSEREQYKAVLGVWKTQLEQLTGNNTPEWEQLRQSNPAEWSARMLERRNQLEQLNAVVAEQQRLTTDEKAKQDDELKRRVAEESRKMLDAVPEWKDQAVYLADSNKIFEYVQARGYTPQEVGRYVAMDHRLAPILKDAMSYRALQAKKPEAQKRVEVARPLPPGPAAPQSSKPDLKKLFERQAKRGDRESSAALFDALGLSR